MAIKSPISKRLKEARILAGISQKQLGIVAGIDEFVASARMNQYETGRHTPEFSVLETIAKALKLPAAFFYTNDDVLAEIIKLYAKLDANARRKILKTLQQNIK